MKLVKYTLLAAAAVCGLAGCSDSFMDTTPSDKIGEFTALGSLENAYVAVNGIHRSLTKQYLSFQSCGGEASMNIFRDVLGDDLVHPTTGNGWYNSEMAWVSHRSTSSTLTKYGLYFYYQIVLNANLILDVIDDIEGEDTDLRNGIIGECYTFRAWAHFNVLQLYAQRYEAGKENTQPGIPYQKTADTEPMARNTVEECYRFIHEDLDKAIEHFKNTGDSYGEEAPYEALHLSLKVAYGVKARVYLTQHNYTEAARYADLAIQQAESEGGKLMTGEELMHGFATILASTNEAMWGSNPQDDHTIYFYSFYAYMSWNFNSTAIRQCPRSVNKLLYEKISDTDERKQWWDPTGEAGVSASNYSQFPYQNRKYTARSTGNGVGDYAFMRLAEMYLIKAEALARNGQQAEAQSVLTTFALTRDPQYTATSSTAAELAEEIMIHRRVELWGEGFRFTDLKRLNLPLDRRNSNHVSSIIQQAEYIEADDIRWEFLFHDEEINANPELEQNPV
ncbi:MAG: RagB/SusD family nutrient uptake outer membrane protein [Tannerellaceae bacterium]|nr:RagB/SusD family nutrient uptake outer membrane protein [Tannerellaceae bacterium]MCD8263724.1 RagB/SusD family nutrient uptake outer membrane protein [Tannerellaceae bacterium]